MHLDVMLLTILAVLAIWTEVDKWKAARLHSPDELARSDVANQSIVR